MPLQRLLVLIVLTAGWTIQGCANSANRSAPDDIAANVDQNLRLVAHGSNKQLTFKADHAGLIRLYDVQKGDYLYSGALKPGDQFVLEPETDHATINKQPAYLDHATNRYDEYRLYFLSQ